MAVAIQSVSTTAYATISTGGTLTITKPTGLAVGDLMVVHIGMTNTSGEVTILGFTNTGWNSLANVADSFTRIDATAPDDFVATLVAYRVATSGDVAGSNFTFSRNGEGDLQVAGAIYRIDGQDPTPISAFLAATVVNDSTPSFATGVTPSASCLLLMLNSSYDATAPTGVSGYAVTTSDPSWTERYDLLDTASSSTSGASAIRPETTSTGAWVFTVGGSGASSTDNVSILVAITPVINVTLTPDAQVVVSSIPAPAVTGDSNVSPDAQAVAFSSPAPTISTKNTIYSNQSKSATISPSNTSKNTISPTNASKNTISPTNLSKSPQEI